MQAWWNAIISWVPFILLIGFWLYFMKKMRTSRQGQLIDRSFEHMDRVEALLQRIATALDQQRPASGT
jgi:ATP-dependent Zn protease